MYLANSTLKTRLQGGAAEVIFYSLFSTSTFVNQKWAEEVFKLYISVGVVYGVVSTKW